MSAWDRAYRSAPSAASGDNDVYVKNAVPSYIECGILPVFVHDAAFNSPVWDSADEGPCTVPVSDGLPDYW